MSALDVLLGLYGVLLGLALLLVASLAPAPRGNYPFVWRWVEIAPGRFRAQRR